MSETTITLRRETAFQLPNVPNFIRHAQPAGRRQDGFHESQVTDIADLSNDELQAIGRAWVAALLAQAQSRRSRRAMIARLEAGGAQ